MWQSNSSCDRPIACVTVNSLSAVAASAVHTRPSSSNRTSEHSIPWPGKYHYVMKYDMLWHSLKYKHMVQKNRVILNEKEKKNTKKTWILQACLYCFSVHLLEEKCIKMYKGSWSEWGHWWPYVQVKWKSCKHLSRLGWKSSYSCMATQVRLSVVVIKTSIYMGKCICTLHCYIGTILVRLYVT